MREYVSLSAELRDDPRRLREWVALALAYAASLPAKKPKTKAKPKKAAGPR